MTGQHGLGSAGPGGAWYSVMLERCSELVKSFMYFILNAIEGNKEFIKEHAIVWPMI